MGLENLGPEEGGDDLSDEDVAGEGGSGEGGSGKGGEDESGTGLGGRDLIGLVQEKFGLDVRHYENDEALLQGLVHAKTLVGQRDIKSQAFDRLRERFGDEGVMALLREESGEGTGEVAVPAQPVTAEQPVQPSGGADVGGDVEYDPSWWFQIESDPQQGWRAKPGSDPEIPQKLMKFLQKREAVLNEFVRDPASFLRQQIGDALDNLREDIQNELAGALQQTVATVGSTLQANTWAEENADVLFVDGDPGKGFSKVGQAFLDRAAELQQAGVTDTVKLFDLALGMVRRDEAGGADAGANKRKGGTREAPPTAKHHGGAGRATGGKQMTAEEYIEQGYDLVDALRLAGEMG